MDLGCIDMGCIEKQSKETSPDKQNSPNDPMVMDSSKNSKSNPGILNKFTSQIKKPMHRKGSPLNWFPRKKVDSYLKRKIKLLQEVDGMHLTLDETLGDSCPHYSRVLREKMAVREAACKAMETRKAAMVEASWCRILQAARIESKEAEAELLKAEESAKKAFEAASANGVVLHDIPDYPQKRYKIETSSPKGGSTTHTIKASFETAFDVDKQVAAAVKSAFMKLANCSSINKDDFKELLRKISEHPDSGEHFPEISEFSSECESDSGVELESRSQKEQKKRQVFDKFKMTNLVEMMLERLKRLQEDELASLATIVATCGLNAALAEAENSSPVADNASTRDAPIRRISSFQAGKTKNSNSDGHVKKKMTDPELPSLDKFLVKRLTRLEREVLEAKIARSSEQAQEENEQKLDKSRDEKFCQSDLGNVLQKPLSKFEKEIEEAKKNSGMIFNYERKKSESNVASDVVPDLGSMLIKHTSKLEKEVAEAKRKNDEKLEKRTIGNAKEDAIEVPSLDKYLVKHMSRLEKEVHEAKNRRFVSPVKEDAPGKENIDQNNNEPRESEKMQEPSSRTDHAQRHCTKLFENCSTDCEGLDKILVKHVSRLEKEKLSVQAKDEPKVKRRDEIRKEIEMSEGSLDQVLVKRKSRLEREKMSAAQELDYQVRHSSARREAREKEMQEIWGGLSLDMSRSNLDQVLVKRESRLEREKMLAAQQPDNQIRHSTTRQQAREKELQEAWGGLGLGNSTRPHISRLERDKAAWLKAEEEERQKAKEV